MSVNSLIWPATKTDYIPGPWWSDFTYHTEKYVHKKIIPHRGEIVNSGGMYGAAFMTCSAID